MRLMLKLVFVELRSPIKSIKARYTSLHSHLLIKVCTYFWLQIFPIYHRCLLSHSLLNATFYDTQQQNYAFNPLSVLFHSLLALLLGHPKTVINVKDSNSRLTYYLSFDTLTIAAVAFLWVIDPWLRHSCSQNV